MSPIAASTTGVTPLQALPLRCGHCAARYDAAPSAICADCLGPLEPWYDPARSLPDHDAIASRPTSIWRYREWLPFEGSPARSLDTGWTPLLEAPALARALGVANAWIKNDAVSHPTLSFKDRVVAAAINAAAAFQLDTFGCASTGNLANAVAAQGARAGLESWIFIPHDLELAKVVGTAVYDPHLIRVQGTYDDVNRLCAQIADRFGWGMANVNLRSYYGEGSKTVAFEITEQLGWRFPSVVVAPMAGGSLVTKLFKGFSEFRDAGLATESVPRIYGAQASGCAPITRLVERGDNGPLVPEVPNTIARSLAIGSPPDGPRAAQVIRETGGWAVATSDAAIVDGIRALARSTGVFTETAGGVTVAGAFELARTGHFHPDDVVVLCITGNGLKTVEAVSDGLDLPLIPPSLKAVEALAEQTTTTSRRRS